MPVRSLPTKSAADNHWKGRGTKQSSVPCVRSEFAIRDLESNRLLNSIKRCKVKHKTKILASRSNFYPSRLPVDLFFFVLVVGFEVQHGYPSLQCSEFLPKKLGNFIAIAFINQRTAVGNRLDLSIPVAFAMNRYIS